MTTKKLNITESVTPYADVASVLPDRKAEAKAKLQKYIAEETKMVKGIFQFFDCPGMRAKITVQKYPGVKRFEQEMDDGKEYEIPLYVARFLNGIDVTAEAIDGKLGTCSYPVHSHLVDKDGVAIISTAKRKRRFGFQSLEFGGFVL